jgi:hypothetical protein
MPDHTAQIFRIRSGTFRVAKAITQFDPRLID